MTKDFFNIEKPSVAIRFLDFPTLVIPGELSGDGRLTFNKGKSTSFKMHSETLKTALQSKPFYVMFIDANTQNVKMLASSNVNIGVIAHNCLMPETPEQNVRRNYLVLFDSSNQECVKMDVSIGVSLVDRQKEVLLKDRLQNIHPSIPGAKMPKEDRKELNLQKFKVTAKEDSVTVESVIEEDPQIVIKQARHTSQQVHTIQATKSPIMVVETALSSVSRVPEELPVSKSAVEDTYRKDAAKMVQFIEQENYKERSQSTLASLLAQPYCPPPMIYEKQVVAPPERAILTKAAAVQVHNKSQTLKFVQEAIKLQAEKFQLQTHSKDDLITRQQEMIVEQRKQILVSQQQQNAIRTDPNVIQINDLQKIKGLELQDRYNVLEMLVKELIGMRENNQPNNQELSDQRLMMQQMQKMMETLQSKNNAAARSPTPPQYDAGRFSNSGKKTQPAKIQHQSKNNVESARITHHNLSQQLNAMVKGPSSERVDHLRESKTIEESIVESPRKEWEETIDSKQNLTLSEQPRTGKAKPQVAVVKSNDSYEDDDFEEISISKSNQQPAKTHTKTEDVIVCPDCRTKLPKNQQFQHKKICQKQKQAGRTRKSMELSSEKTSERKYSPIRESKHDEEDSSSQYTSVQESESQSLPRQTGAARKHQISVAPPSLSATGTIGVNVNSDLKGIDNTNSVGTEENEDRESDSSYTVSASNSVSQSDANTKAQWNQLAKKYLHNKGNQSSDSSELSADED